MTQTLWIIRHGNREDFGNPNWASSAKRPYDPALSADGERQAQEAGSSLRQQPVHRIFASPFLRTIQTAHHIADAVNLPVALEPGIGEVLPNVQQMPALLAETERSQQFARLDAAYQPIGVLAYPENEADGHRRSGQTVQQLADALPSQNLLFVTHASPVIGIVRHLTGIQEQISVPLCGIFTLQRNGSGWHLVGEGGSVAHLSDSATSLRYAHSG
ncbi:MAG: phosphoglycerate mutase family protein [Caldilineaceae bacterium]|nr:phosphoglycerate mutase family protein [Caldilineaceae bacterium]